MSTIIERKGIVLSNRIKGNDGKDRWLADHEPWVMTLVVSVHCTSREAGQRTHLQRDSFLIGVVSAIALREFARGK
jgi:hypothetical protein